MDLRFVQQLECVPDTEGGEAAFVVLEQKVEKGAKRRFGCIGESEKNRLAHEFELIHATNTAKLFLYWADIVAAIRQKIYPYIYSVQNCSLVCYCLGITEVNPLLTGSYFERLLTRRSTHVPILFIEVPKGRGREASEVLKEKTLIEIEENAACPDLDPIDVMDFFKRQTYENRKILQSAAASLEIAAQKPPETVRALADLLVYKRYKEFMDETGGKKKRVFDRRGERHIFCRGKRNQFYRLPRVVCCNGTVFVYGYILAGQNKGINSLCL